MNISTRTHAFLDFATAGALIFLPRMLGASSRFTKITTALGVGKLGYALLTRHELGAARIIPMNAHLALDTAGGATLCSLPLLLEDKENPAVTAFAVGLGLFDIAAAPLTDTQSLPSNIRGIATGTTAVLPGQHRRWISLPPARRLPQASLSDSIKIGLGVAAPTIAMGPIIRRPKIMALAESLGFATGAVQTLQRLRDKYGTGPLMMKMPLRRQAVLLDPAHVRRVLDESPEPFATASTEKQAALAHFEPKMALVSHGPERTERRQLNERVLEQSSPVHHLGWQLLPIVDDEARGLLARVGRGSQLRWEAFADAWFRIVRRVVFGDAAREDHRISYLMATLRSHANWAFVKPIRKDLRNELHQRIGGYLEQAQPGSLVSYMAARRPTATSEPENQIPQWLFAFDPAGMATFRALALLAAHPEQLASAREEAAGGVAAARPHRPLLRATVLESLRLWPTTPLLLRQTTRETQWETGTMPAHTGILIYAPFFHRDETRLPFAHSFAPQVWLEDDPEVQGAPPRRWPLVPFSGGPGICPGRNLVLMLTSGMLAALIGQHDIRLLEPHRLPPGSLPGTLDHFSLRFELTARAGLQAAAVSSDFVQR